MTPEDKLIFIYVGDNFPKYGKYSLHLAKQLCGLEIILLCNKKIFNKLNDEKIQIALIAIEEFYDNSKFREVEKLVTFDHNFRGGFWLKSLERFFIMEQFMKYANMKNVIHAELDQVLFRIDILIENLNLLNRQGFYIPFHVKESAVASLIFCNDINALESLTDFALENGVFPNEMVLLSRWAYRNSDRVFALPTLSSQLKSDFSSYLTPIKLIDSVNVGGVVDAAQVGQWLGGIDPRNVPIRQIPRNKFVDKEHPMLLKRSQFQDLKFELELDSFSLFAQYQYQEKIRIFNLHLHSKIHQQLLPIDTRLKRFIYDSNIKHSHRFHGTRYTQLKQYLVDNSKHLYINRNKLRPYLLKKIALILRFKPSSYPYISKYNFREIADLEISSKKIGNCSNGKKIKVIYIERESLEYVLNMDLIDYYPSAKIIVGGNNKPLNINLQERIKQIDMRQIYVQNPNFHDLGKIVPVPLGIKPFQKIGKKKISSEMQNEKLYRIVWDFPIIYEYDEIVKVANILVNCEIADRSEGNTKDFLNRYAFRACPTISNGDDYRIWESIYSGTIPILLESDMANYLGNLNLPIHVVREFTEILDIGEDDLQNLYDKLKSRFETKALWMDYWKQKILNFK